jgi:acetoacetyl-CoA synthetase
VEVVLCVKLRNGQELTTEIAAQIRATIRRHSSARHVPAAIYAVSAIPQTANGKRNEAAARAAALGDDTSKFTSRANRECLAEHAALDGTRGL